MATTNRPDRTPARPPIGFLLRTLDGLIDQRFERTLGAHGVTRRQWQLLRTLDDGAAPLDALNAAVAPFLDVDSGETAARHLGPLVERGAVTSADDVYELTDAGAAL